MKKNAYKIVALFLLIFGIASCTSDMNYKPGGTTAVEALHMPVSGYYAELRSASGASQTFSWEASSAQDGQLPQYEIVFYAQPDGEIVYRYDAGVKTSVHIPDKELNKAASAAGIATGEDGILYWTVISSRAVDETLASCQPNKLSIKRLFGFEVIPPKLYITGTASETGADLETALSCKLGGDQDIYEVFTKLVPGEYQFVDKEGRSFYINNGALAENLSGADQSTTITTEGIYRITLDFGTRSTAITEVTKMLFVICGGGGEFPLDYQSSGVWASYNQEVHFRAGGSWQDRYFFIATIDGEKVKIGSKADGDGNEKTDEGKGNLNFLGMGSTGDWSYSFGFFIPGSDPVNIDIKMDLGGNADYYHQLKQK